jgi:GrpB-like predicted nucleotidyltransferase (UPF0157 family)/RimJ/RimL family protein N-acetyltransferase
MCLQSLIPEDFLYRISHIGSTAINGIWAKNIVDVLVEIKKGKDMNEIATILSKNDFVLMSQNKTRISLNRGYTPNGYAEKVYHIHLRYQGDNNELYFRDYLNSHPDIAKEYETLKIRLSKEFEHNRDGYTDAKTEFINKYTEKAKKDWRENMTILRNFNDGDLETMEKWLCQPCILKWYVEPSAWLYEIIHRHDKYSFIHHFIVQVDGKDVGFCQYYPHSLGGETWHGSTSIEGTYSIDYLIGEEEYLGKGFGKRLIQTLIRKVFNETDAERIIVQPDKDNLFSRNTLLSAGFSYFEKDSIFIITRKIKR